MKLIVAGPIGAVEHDGGTFHPEQRTRILAVKDGIQALGSELEVVYPPTAKAEHADLARVHSSAYLAELEAFCDKGGGDIDPDTFVCRTRGMLRDVRQEPGWRPSRRWKRTVTAWLSYRSGHPGTMLNGIERWGFASSTMWRSPPPL